LARVPFKRFGEAKDIANAVLFLASDESVYVHSTEIVVDGGLTGSPSAAPG
jgi:NAD(P)-dependent dehydrogenase (short-subunit alcohol dehydrogenase family)